MSICQAIVGGRKLWLGVNRLLERLRSLPFFLVTDALAIFVQVEVALKVCVQRFGINRPQLRHCRLIWSSESYLNLPCDILGHVSFQREDVAQVALVAVGPQVFVCWAMDQLRGDAHA